jgi:DNA-binding NarL/FixJ family response regulator
MTVDKPDRPKALSPGRLLSGLSPLEFDVLKRLRQNMQHSAIAHELGICGSELTTQICHILTSIGAPDRTTLLATVDLFNPDDAVTPEAPPHRE